MKNDTNTKLIEVRNLVVAARRQMEKAYNIVYDIENHAHSTVPSCPEASITIYCEAVSAINFAQYIAMTAKDLMADCQCMRDIRQHDIELNSQKGKEADE